MAGESSFLDRNQITNALLNVCAAVTLYLGALRDLTPLYGSFLASQWAFTFQLGVLGCGVFVAICQRAIQIDRALYWITRGWSVVLSQMHWSLLQGPTYGPSLTFLCLFVPTSLLYGDAVLALRGADGRTTFAINAVMVGAAHTIVLATVNWFMANLEQTGMLFFRNGLKLVTLACLLRLPKRRIFLTSLLMSFLFGHPYVRLPHSDVHRVLDRRDSVTGYVSVIHSLELDMLALRCDHSLLGGEWLVTEERKQSGLLHREPIYPVFTMLEAIRLMEPAASTTTSIQAVADADGSSEATNGQNALVIGLGIGTCPSALTRHGINTTVVEIDPAVTYFAQRYFGLPPSVDVKTEDAIKHVQTVTAESQDYIVHDVFTGGAEPLQLFTLEFLMHLKSALKHHGTIAINYAGDAKTISSSVVLNTIRRVFGNCRAFRDAPPNTSQDEFGDMVNLVMFCSRDSSRSWNFRRPVKADYLDTITREESLSLPHEMPLHKVKEDAPILTAKDIGLYSSRQGESILKHWHVMRTVLPAKVWEMF